MAVVVISKYVYVASNKDAVKLAKRERMMGKRVEIISDADYEKRRPKMAEIQDLDKWKRDNP